jgi:PAS domain S-box-containing protein
MRTKGNLFAKTPASGKSRKKKTLSTSAPSPLVDFSKLWQQAFNASPDMISIVDVNHRIISVNEAMAKAIQCSPSKTEGRHCYQLMHESDQPPPACPHRAMMADGKAHHSEIYEERLNLWLLVTVTPLYGNNHELIGGIHIGRDITRQKQTEQALRESEERFRHLSEATMEGVLLSEDSNIIAVNQVLTEMVGYSMEELRGMNLLKLIVPQDRNRLIQYLRNRRSGVHEFQCVHKDGTVFPIEAHSRAITYKDGMVYQTAIRDLTEQKRVEQSRLAQEKMQGVLELAGAVCHEFNQPLMALQGFVDIFQAKTANTEAISKHLDRIREQIDRLGALTRKLMNIATYETKAYAGGETIIDIDQATSKKS